MLTHFALILFVAAQGEHELTGNEDPSVLNAYISYLPSRIAYKEGNISIFISLQPFLIV